MTRLAAGPDGTHAIDRCEWYRIAVDGADRSVCWSRSYKMPLLVLANGESTALWKVTAISTAAVSDRTFTIDDVGYVRNDANQDIAND